MVTRVKRVPKRTISEVDSGSEVSPRKSARPTTIKIEAECSALADERVRSSELRGQIAALSTEITELKREQKKLEVGSKKSDDRATVAQCELQHSTTLVDHLRAEIQTATASLARTEEVFFIHFLDLC